MPGWSPMQTRTALLVLLFPVALAQINVQVKIIDADEDSNIEQGSLNQQLANQNLSSAVVVSAESGSELLIQQCPTGTYAEGSSTVCSQCAAGTASPVIGATTHLTCQTCSPGTFSLVQSATCSLCASDTFSPDAAAVSSSACLQCPPNSASLPGSDMITKCTCNSRYFIPTNTLQVLDPAAPVQFGSWASLTVNTPLINVPHLSC